jgi:hypothetical protein
MAIAFAQGRLHSIANFDSGSRDRFEAAGWRVLFRFVRPISDLRSHELDAPKLPAFRTPQHPKEVAQQWAAHARFLGL